MEEEFKRLLTAIKLYNSNKGDIELIRSAWEFAKFSHFGQKRKSGELYITHPLAVAKRLAEWK